MEYWLKFLGVMASVALADVCWTYYMIKVSELKALPSGLWSAAIIALGSFTVTEYINDRSLVVAAIIGAFVGTYFSILFKKYKPKYILIWASNNLKRLIKSDGKI